MRLRDLRLSVAQPVKPRRRHSLRSEQFPLTQVGAYLPLLWAKDSLLEFSVTLPRCLLRPSNCRQVPPHQLRSALRRPLRHSELLQVLGLEGDSRLELRHQVLGLSWRLHLAQLPLDPRRDSPLVQWQRDRYLRQPHLQLRLGLLLAAPLLL